MIIYKDQKFLSSYSVLDILLDNGVLIHAKPNGTATDDNGNKYYAVSKEIINEYGMEEIINLGWTKDATAPVHC